MTSGGRGVTLGPPWLGPSQQSHAVVAAGAEARTGLGLTGRGDGTHSRARAWMHGVSRQPHAGACGAACEGPG